MVLRQGTMAAGRLKVGRTPFSVFNSAPWPAIRSVWRLLPSSVVIKSFKADFSCSGSTSPKHRGTAQTASPSFSRSARRRSRAELWTSRWTALTEIRALNVPDDWYPCHSLSGMCKAVYTCCCLISGHLSRQWGQIARWEALSGLRKWEGLGGTVWPFTSWHQQRPKTLPTTGRSSRLPILSVCCSREFCTDLK